MLVSPLHFLSYIDRRTGYGDKVVSGRSRVTILGYHLSSNLWLSNDTEDLAYDDLASSLDAAMAVRRDGVPGERMPPGILTLTKGSATPD